MLKKINASTKKYAKKIALSGANHSPISYYTSLITVTRNTICGTRYLSHCHAIAYTVSQKKPDTYYVLK